MSVAPAPELLVFMSVAPAPELLVFMSVAPELSFFMAPVPAPASHIDISNVLRASSWMENELNHVNNTERIYQTFLTNLIW